jgi:hypothetical protein
MVLARHSLAIKNTEPSKILAPNRLMVSAAVVAALSAAAVFVFLLFREQRLPIVANAGVHTGVGAIARPAAIRPGPSLQTFGNPRTNEIAFETFNFSLEKSRSYRAVGPVRVRLLRTDKSASYDVAILVHNKRTKKSRVRPGEPIAIALPGSRVDTRMVITRIAKNQVWGYLVTPKSRIKPVVQTGHRR